MSGKEPEVDVVSHGGLEISIFLDENKICFCFIDYLFGVLHWTESCNVFDDFGVHGLTIFRKDVDVGEFDPYVLEDF